MDIEKSIFTRCNLNIKKLLDYGFVKENDYYKYQKKFLNEDFLAEIIIKDNNVSGNVYDLVSNCLYTNIRLEVDNGFINIVRNSYKDILIDIKNNCFDNLYFKYQQTNRIVNYIISKYSDYPEFPWDDCNGIFRNKRNNKWYALIMLINKNKIDNINKEIEVINLKLNEEEIKDLIKKEGYYQAYHMNKKMWITISLDDTLTDKEIIKCIDKSYEIINSKR